MKKYTAFLVRVIGAGTFFGLAAALLSWCLFAFYGDRFALNRAAGLGALVLCFCATWASTHWAHLRIRSVPARGGDWTATTAGIADWLFAACSGFVAVMVIGVFGDWSIMDADSNGFASFTFDGHFKSVLIWVALPLAGAFATLVVSRVIFYLAWWSLLLARASVRLISAVARSSGKGLLARPDDLGLEAPKKV
jgi:hypothetical protein